mmetsp:Transcript_40370/g.120431  ORF Transcript_40370/g.120431 Transcript_40370/m.120431 type:complete len:200 (-) Transcript_40370:702-1301(-)
MLPTLACCRSAASCTRCTRRACLTSWTSTLWRRLASPHSPARSPAASSLRTIASSMHPAAAAAALAAAAGRAAVPRRRRRRARRCVTRCCVRRRKGFSRRRAAAAAPRPVAAAPTLASSLTTSPATQSTRGGGSVQRRQRCRECWTRLSTSPARHHGCSSFLPTSGRSMVPALARCLLRRRCQATARRLQGNRSCYWRR